MAEDQKILNALAARLTKVEMLLEQNDVYAPPGAVSLQDFNFGPEVQQPPDFNQFMQWDPQFANTVGQFDPFTFQERIDEELQANDGFTPSQGAIDALYDRLEALETALSNGSRDTDQDGALAAGQETEQDGLIGEQDPIGDAVGGLGTMAYQNASGVAITGGSISALTNAAATWTFTTMALTPSTSATLTSPTITLRDASSPATSLAMTSTSTTLTTASTNTLSDSGASVGLSSSAKTTQVSGSTVTIAPSAGSTVRVGGATSTLQFFNGSSGTLQTVTGSRGGNAALQSLLTALGSYGFIIDSSS